jgi:5'-phosphate synthase pdxT subunit
MLRFIEGHNMLEPLRTFVQNNPTWGICAGSILLAQEVINPSQASLKAIDITAHRNFYGSQLDSFVTPISVDLLPTEIEAHFIRAPLLKANPAHPTRAPLSIHAHLETQPVFFSQNRIWACSFHVELGSDTRLHQLFAAL